MYYQFRIFITYKHSVYWATVIRDYLFECVDLDRISEVGFSDIMDFDEYLWRLYTFRKNKMIKDEHKLKALKKYLVNK